MINHAVQLVCSSVLSFNIPLSLLMNCLWLDVKCSEAVFKVPGLVLGVCARVSDGCRGWRGNESDSHVLSVGRKDTAERWHIRNAAVCTHQQHPADYTDPAWMMLYNLRTPTRKPASNSLIISTYECLRTIDEVLGYCDGIIIIMWYFNVYNIFQNVGVVKIL